MLTLSSNKKIKKKISKINILLMYSAKMQIYTFNQTDRMLGIYVYIFLLMLCSVILVRSRKSPHSYFCICQFLLCKLFLTVLLLLMLSLMLHLTVWHTVHNQVIPSIYTLYTTDQANCLHHASNLTNLQSCIKDSLQIQGLSSRWNCLVILNI